MCLKSRGLGQTANMGAQSPPRHPCPVPRPGVLTRDEGPFGRRDPLGGVGRHFRFGGRGCGQQRAVFSFRP